MQKVRFWDPEHWRFRAEEARTVADQMTHEEARTIVRRITAFVRFGMATCSSCFKAPGENR